MTTSLINHVIKKSTYLVTLASLAAVILADNKVPSISIAAGGLVGIVNFILLARIAEKLLNRFMPGLTIAFFSFIKIVMTGIILFILIQFKLVSIPFFLLGFTCVVIFILWEGAMVVKRGVGAEEL